MIQERELFLLKAQQECILQTIHQLKRGNDMRMRDKLTQTDRQTDRQTQYIQTHTHRHADRQTDRQTQTDRLTDRHRDIIHTNTHTPHRHADRQTDRYLSGHSASIEEGSLELSSISL